MSQSTGRDEVKQLADLIPPDWPNRPLLVHFYIPAPFPMGVPAGTILTLLGSEELPWLQGTLLQQTVDSPLFVPPESIEAREFVSLRIGRRTVPGHMSMWEADAAFSACAGIFGSEVSRDWSVLGSAGASPSVIPRSRDVTVFEAVTPLLPEQKADSADAEKSVSASFDRCLDALNELLRAYSIKTKDWRVRPLTRQSMAQVIPWGVREPDSETPRGLGMFLVNEGDPLEQESIPTLSEEEVRDLVMVVSRQRQGGERGDPIATAAEHARRAQRALYVEGDYPVSIVWSYTWLETLLDAVLLLTAWDEGVDGAEAAKWFASPLVKRVQGRFPKRLKGMWYTRETSGPFALWERRVARFRHRVIHANYRATEKDARDALEASGRLEDYVTERLAKRSAAYPRAALITMGEPGLSRRSALNRQVVEAIKSSADDDSWLASFAEYESRVIELSRYSGT